MSPTNSTEENWVLLQTRYDYIALPAELGLEVMKRMVVLSKDGKKYDVATGEVTVTLVPGELITVARVKAKMLPEDKEE